MRTIFLCVLLLVLASPAVAQDVGTTLSEEESKAVQEFRIIWAPRISQSNTQTQNVAIVANSVMALANSYAIDTTQCRDAELTVRENAVLGRVNALVETYRAAFDGEAAHDTELQARYRSSTDYGQQLALYSALVAAKGRTEMFAIIAPPLKSSAQNAMKAIAAACILRRTAKLRPQFTADNLYTDGLHACEMAEDLFIKGADVYDLTFEFINRYRL